MFAKRFSQEIEEKWQDEWEKKGTYTFRGLDDRKAYAIDTPPPFTSGELHMGHALSYAYFDFVARYKRMQGFNVYYPQGWDTQGFPTETKVEKKYGRLSREEFREKCVEWTDKMIEKMKDSMVKLGFSPDWEHQYRTLDKDYHRKVQLSLHIMYDKNMIYRDEHPVFWCYKCHSALAKTDTEDLEREALLNHIVFKGPEGEDLIIATTRPELMYACVAVMYHPDDERYKSLEGKKATTALGKEVPIIPDKDVDKEYGTGLLMVCTFGDKQDIVWAYRHKLPIISILDQHGKLTGTGEFDGLKPAQAKETLIQKFREEGKIVKQETLPQVIKVHDRCKAPVEYAMSKQWFADITNHREKIKQMAREMRWVPEFGINYLDNWADSIEWDWVISRQRHFGTPIPFYYCEKCGKTAKADSLPFYPEKAPEKTCKCGGKMKPEESVLDCWVDSSITPLIVAGWPDREGWERMYPSALRPQGVEIVRTWAFYTIYRSGIGITGEKPWDVVLLNGNVLAPDGRKMSKSLGNVISPTDLLKEYPADAIRQWAAMSGAMAKDRPFSYEDIKFAKSFLNKVWNASKFVQKGLEGYDNSKPELKLVDKWMMESLNKAIEECTDAMENYEFHRCMRKLHDFFWHDFCDDYLEYVKYRTYGEDDESKKAAQYVLHEVLYSFIKMLAPVSPHISEEIYHGMFGGREGDTINFTPWPKVGNRFPQEFEKVEPMREIISRIRQAKAAAQISQGAEIILITPKLGLDPELIEEVKKITRIREIKEGEFKVEKAEEEKEA
ncbi:valine--tRNA ligase [Candidatus Micrarchaeota archaeon]|nr:valine--tRNA ligase [Candidatus Micrarchaeota archaeon]MBD3417508.1 valine--tRNA ligase [Candidatus Micrarchaeota archaeon]